MIGLLALVFIADAAMLELLCRQFDAAPTAAQLVSAHPLPSEGLLALANDASKPAWLRARAVHLLPLTDGGVEALDTLTLASDVVLRRAAAPTLARAVPERALALLTLQLLDPEPSIRKTAALALRRVRDARTPLVAHLATERDTGVRDAVIVSLSQLR